MEAGEEAVEMLAGMVEIKCLCLSSAIAMAAT
jgi:hypothetical protein